MMKIGTALLAGLALLATVPAAAQTPAKLPYPVKLVTLVTHSTPGAGSDVVLREMIKYLERYIDTKFIVENDEGGSGAKAMARVAGAKPDGSMLYATTPTYILTSLLSKPSRTYRDLEPLVNTFTDSEVVYTRADAPYKSLNDVIAKARASRGRWGVSNPASLERESAEQLKTNAKVNAAIVSHDGGGDMMINVLNGTLDMGVGEIDEIRAQLEGRKVRVLATFNPNRLPGFPTVPTVSELGYKVVVSKFRGLAGPKGLPPSLIKTWEQAIQRVLADPEFKKSYAEDDLVADYIPHDQYGPFIEKFAADSGNFLKTAGMIR
ncbi:MAG: tripartite tricarboxylate transporter substrate binding protein [Alphaproteobacteria bacterium]|nr:tripartite tricarboxylate transporter substrate binding protein [Alphaproteobacteria bacterium]